MAQLNSMLNFCVVTVVVIAALFWVGTPAPPRPLPNDAQFVAQVQQPGIVLVKFGADWCPPCRMIEKELDSLSGSADVSIVKIDVDKNRALAAHYQISSIPQLLLFKNGKQVDRASGYRTQDQLRKWIAASR